MHHLNGSIRCLEGVIADESKAPRGACVRVPHNLGGRHHHAKATEGVIQLLQAHIQTLKGGRQERRVSRVRAGQEEPVSGPRTILGVATTMPNPLKVSYSCSRHTSRLKGVAGRRDECQTAGRARGTAQVLQPKGACRPLTALCSKGTSARMVTETQCSCYPEKPIADASARA